MEIERMFNGETNELAVKLVKDYMMDYTVYDILSICDFPFPAHYYLTEDARNKAADVLCSEKLLLSIFDLYLSNDESMSWAIEQILMKFGKENPNFLEQFYTIEAIAYKKYQKDWFDGQNFSKEYIEKIKEEYEEKCKELDQELSMLEYLDVYGFHGSLYARFDEFLNNEYKDVIYMSQLLSDEEYEEYLSKNFKYVWKDIVYVNNKFYVEKFPVKKVDCQSDPESIVSDFLEFVARKHHSKKIETYAMDGIYVNSTGVNFDKRLCGLHIQGYLVPECMESNRNSYLEESIFEIMRLQKHTPSDEMFPKSDKILFDLLNSTTWKSAIDVFGTWRRSKDRKSVEQMFFNLTGCKFHDFLQDCKNSLFSANLAYAAKDWIQEVFPEEGDVSFSELHKNYVQVLSKWEYWQELVSDDDKSKFFDELIEVAICFPFYDPEDAKRLADEFSDILGIIR